MTEARIRWHRYVDDYVLVASSHADAYKALAFLSHTLADYGLTLNKTKTVMLTAKHYSDYVAAQLGSNDDEAGKLREIVVKDRNDDARCRGSQVHYPVDVAAVKSQGSVRNFVCLKSRLNFTASSN